MVASILARFRMIDGFLQQPIYVRARHGGDRGTFKAMEGLLECVPFAEHDRPTKPDLEHSQSKGLEQRRSLVGSRTPDLIVVPGERGTAGSGPRTTRRPVLTDNRVGGRLAKKRPEDLPG